ncbi:hypothetical protein [Pseudomonas mediterranea]|uniref:hypothetical protein n=1 Tax=Pseudomonas mediterranea TaxID=183795 RepID=UPI0013C2D1E1|nr:hypothetical protein [Pseudomonas mediterranea]UZE03481.1 hypothetical protein LOY71_12925 [Pseudomonas mediterranea]
MIDTSGIEKKCCILRVAGGVKQRLANYTNHSMRRSRKQACHDRFARRLCCCCLGLKGCPEGIDHLAAESLAF